MIKTQHHMVSNGDGWRLSLFQTWDDERLVRARRPVLIVPGYGMNSFIFGYHPRGVSMEGFLVEAGFEVWRADLRAQGDSRSVGGGDDFAMEDLALTDLGAAVDAVLHASNGHHDRVDVIGASLGGTLMFLHAALNPENRFGSMVAMGAPVRWVRVHPAIRLAFSSPMLVGLVRFRGTRRLAELALPRLAAHAPWLLSIYMNPTITDTRAARDMVKTVEDPNRHINREIARWIRARDLVVRGINLAESLSRVRNPFLCVFASHDGIVPRETATFAYDHVGSTHRRLLEVGDADMAVAHADLFISNEAHTRVFRPLASWLAERYEPVTAPGP